MMMFHGRSYAPTLTPKYENMTPNHGGQSPYAAAKTPFGRTPTSASQTPQPGPSRTPQHDSAPPTFSRPHDPPGYSPLYVPLYSPGDTPTYSGHTPGHSGITPGYSGPSPEDNPMNRATPAQHSPVYTGPPPGMMSNASTPGHADAQEDFVEPRYTPS